jgi:glycosyltransferase involved in cell wall biosynthesis
MYNMRKKRILHVGESNFLSTGYGTYARALLSYLHNTGKYEIAELGCYCGPNDPRPQAVPWKFYPNGPNENDPKEVQMYNSSSLNQFGEWKFEPVCLDFLPDIVFDFRDHWYFTFEEHSPFRRMYNWCICPTVDSLNQHEDWISTFTNADGVFTYTDWSQKVLQEEGGGLINLLGATPVCVELDVFKPTPNKRQHKAMFGLREDAFIIGTVMRNQKRKLYPDMLEAFAKFIEEASPEVADRTFLYIHASYPDLGWDFPRMIKNLGLSNKVLFTYTCFKCGLVFPRFYSDVRTVCPKCHNANATFPNTQQGIDRNALAAIYNIFDLFLQYSICEGQGIGQVEAAACGVPVMSVDYSAMTDVVRKVNGYPIKVQRMFHESETGCLRALPDNEDLIQRLNEFVTLPEQLRAQKGNKARLGAEKHYNWLDTCKKWENYFDSVEVRPLEQTWLSSPHFISSANHINQVPEGMSDEQFVNWSLVNVMGRPDLIGSFFAMKVVRDLSWGASPDTQGGIVFNDLSTLGLKPAYQPYDRNKVIEQFKVVADKNNFWEQQRYNKLAGGNH